MSGISSIGSTTPTQSQILEAELHANLLHKHAPHPATSVATRATQSAGNDPSSKSVGSTGNAMPTLSELLDDILKKRLPNGWNATPTNPAGGQTDQSPSDIESIDIDETA